jgi:hypothetical protein
MNYYEDLRKARNSQTLSKFNVKSVMVSHTAGKVIPTTPPTPPETPPPPPPPTFLHNISGPNTEDGDQKISIVTSGNSDTIYYNNWDGQTITFTATIIYVNGVVRSSVSHTVDRNGTQFGYSIAGSTVQATGVFNGGNVYLTI